MVLGESGSLTVEEIKQIIPHRYPFLLLDRITELSEVKDGPRQGRWVKGYKNVTVNEPFFNGHFPHRPVMPGVLIVESMAQTGAIACYRPSDPDMDVAIVKVDKAKFKRPVVPGDRLDISATVIKERANMIFLDCKAEVDGKLAASAEIVAYVVPIDSL